MAKFRQCACGVIPDRLGIAEGDCSKWAWATCGSCGEWSIEFRTQYSQDPDELNRLAAEAWNGAARG
jgi:hypothetical protein